MVTKTLPRRAYSVRETAAMLSLSAETVRTLIQRGDIRAALIGSRHRIASEEIDRLLRVDGADGR